MAALWESTTIDVAMGQAVGPTPRVRRSRTFRSINARFDIAQTTRENAQHWQWSDGMSALNAANPSVRKILRDRSRYELANNSYYQGMIRTLASDTIGCGPRLALRVPNVKTDDIKTVEREFNKWMKATRFVSKLRTMKKSKDIDGEAIALFVDNPKIRHPVTLDIRLVEAEQMATPMLMIATPQQADGIDFDEYGNPETYHFLKSHPGDPMANFSLQTDPVDADHVIHWFAAERPGQLRGIPLFMSSLPMFANLRRYTLATISAAETAANHSGVIESEFPPDSDEDDVELAPEPGDTFQVDRDSFVTLPQGCKLNQLKPEHPTTTYREFKSECLADIARPASMPKNIAQCDSSGYNYSSGRLDHQLYYKQIEIEQDDCEIVVLGRVFEKWLDQAVLIEDYLPESVRQESLNVVAQWNWDEPVSIDPIKDAQANEILLSTGQATFESVYARKGIDYLEAFDQIATEGQQLASRGLVFSFNTYAPPDPNKEDMPAKPPATGGRVAA